MGEHGRCILFCCRCGILRSYTEYTRCCARYSLLYRYGYMLVQIQVNCYYLSARIESGKEIHLIRLGGDNGNDPLY